MIQRLRDQVDAHDPALRRAAQLLRSLPQPEASLSSARKLRVRAALGRGRARAGRERVLRPAAIALVLIGGVATAREIGLRWRAGARPAAVAVPAPTAVPAPVPVPVSVPVPAPVAAPGAVAETGPVAVGKRAQQPRASSESGAAMLYAAGRALRRQHDPVRAGALIDRYLARFPDGALVEEALALGIEAATARDDVRAADYGARYLERFPSGRFRAAAERARARFAP